MQTLIATLLFMHSAVHLAGFVGRWHPAETTTIFAGAIDVGDASIHFVRSLWLFAAFAFTCAGLAALARLAVWPKLVLALSCFSVGLCLSAWPNAWSGVLVNLALIATVLVWQRTPSL